MSYKIISKSYTDCLLYPQKTADITPPFITYRQEPSFAASPLCTDNMVYLHHHHIPDMELSAFFDKTINVQDDRLIFLKYFLFIKYKENIYVEVKSVGYIIMPFEELLKNKLLKMYYDLSLLLVKDKNRFVEKISDKGEPIWDAEITHIYNGRRNCYVDCAYILNGVVKTDKQYCYYEMNPFELRKPYSLWEGDNYTGVRKFVNTSSEIKWFNNTYKNRLGYEISGFEKRAINYSNIIVEYNANLIETEIDEIAAVQEDKINIIKLVALNEKKGMNADIFQVILNNIISANETERYTKYLEKLDNDKEGTIREIVNA